MDNLTRFMFTARHVLLTVAAREGLCKLNFAGVLIVIVSGLGEWEP